MNYLYAVGGALLVVGAALPIFCATFAYAFFSFALGALLFVPMQLRARYDGDNFVIRRLRRQQLIGAFFICITALLMLSHWQGWHPFRADEWKITLAIAAILELWTAFRLPSELEKDERKRL